MTRDRKAYDADYNAMRRNRRHLTLTQLTEIRDASTAAGLTVDEWVSKRIEALEVPADADAVLEAAQSVQETVSKALASGRPVSAKLLNRARITANRSRSIGDFAPDRRRHIARRPAA